MCFRQLRHFSRKDISNHKHWNANIYTLYYVLLQILEVNTIFESLYRCFIETMSNSEGENILKCVIVVLKYSNLKHTHK